MFRLFAIIMYIYKYIYIHLYKKRLFGSYLYLQCSATCFLRDNLFLFFQNFRRIFIKFSFCRVGPSVGKTQLK